MSALDFETKRAMADRALANQLFGRIAEREEDEHQDELMYEQQEREQAAEEAGRAEGYEDGWGAGLDLLIDILEAKAARDSRAAYRLGLIDARDEAQRLAERGSAAEDDDNKAA